MTEAFRGSSLPAGPHGAALRRGSGVGPESRAGWAAVVLVLTAAAVLLVLLVLAVARAAYLVDMVPGADAGLATSPGLEWSRAQAAVLGSALLLLGVGSGGALLVRRRRARRSGISG